ncbi:MAG: S-methyl-5-thioribose-1-phosphate isomerase, partial [Deltaproteobacteria bacterium]
MSAGQGGNGLSVRTMEWTGEALRLLDQRVLPLRESFVRLTDAAGVAHAIRTMVVRGAPAIGVAAAFGLVLSVKAAGRSKRSCRPSFGEASAALAATRPTAVNLFWAIERMRKAAEGLPE